MKFIKSPIGIVLVIALVILAYRYWTKMEAVKRSAFIIATDPSAMQRVTAEAVNTGRTVSQIIAERSMNMAESVN